jgi:hypothetical protein
LLERSGHSKTQVVEADFGNDPGAVGGAEVLRSTEPDAAAQVGNLKNNQKKSKPMRQIPIKGKVWARFLALRRAPEDKV